MNPFDPNYPGSQYNIWDSGVQQTAGDVAQTASIPTVSAVAARAGTFWHKDSPMFALGALLLIAFGAASVAGSARLGPIKAAAALGDNK